MSELAADVTRQKAIVREPAVQLLASQVLTGAVALAANILMVRSMTPTHRGEVALMLQVVYLATQVVLLGTERSFVAGYHNVAPGPAVRAYAKLLLLPSAIGLAVAVLFTATAAHHRSPGPMIVTLLAVYTVVEASALASRSVAIAVGRVRDFMICRVLESVLLLAMLIGLYVHHTSHPEIWFLAYVFAGAAPTLAYLIIWLRLPPDPDAAPARRDLNRQVRREGLALFPAAISNMAMLRVDRLVIPALASTAALGLYTSVATMTELLAWPIRAYADSRLGHWRAAHRDGSLRPRPIVLAVAVYSLVVVPFVAGALYLLIVPVFGHQYAAARDVVLPLVVAAGLYAVSRVSLGLLIAKGHSKLVSVAEIVGFVVSFAVYLLLIPRRGILGAAYGSLAGYGACLLFALLSTYAVRDRR
ncbi:NAD(P)H-quinone oxidoreductase chain 4 [Actinoplanes sp. SE50]|uniref:polysaccharide biosynthesis C-terminal domain-containing protein n=1 Tax=unclassified Actinoplanes TaxID=2626549 RepID=UPI00023ECB82|nr:MULTISPECIES: polysaccharide biosynthesis C-terminal domain-containing protein [unclassified Actinoplanes]AEV86527.1 NAD(P)H-quinone oxidoreductase chain 4 [Actinoplanes sp. SE50/110]ATO84925.1 NAD(P)H-quinone oxidoreductase chain 4 [Actinoplanes sp. SE50]SLM02334.1 NAD(P)H-quinone oxidoreductase chain 4 [Actinoplanes sp. SE50/110]